MIDLYSLAAGMAPAWLEESTLFSLSPHHPTTLLPALLVITGAWLLLCRFIAALEYQNIYILGGFSIMKT